MQNFRRRLTGDHLIARLKNSQGVPVVAF